MFPPLYGFKNGEDCSNFVFPKMMVSPKTCILNGQIQENVGSHTSNTQNDHHFKETAVSQWEIGRISWEMGEIDL